MYDINPRVDIAFKKIFGVEENKDLLISLINSIVSKEDQVSSATFPNPYNPKSFRNDKLSILDIKATGENDKRFSIEIQITDEADDDKRALYYWGKLYTEQLKSGEDYNNLNKAIGIHILYFLSIPNVKKYHNVFNIREKETNLGYFKDFELHTIELKKFMEEAGTELTTLMSRIKSKIDLWCAFLIRYDLLKQDQLTGTLNDPNLKKALDVLEIMLLNYEEREEYESHLKWMRIEANTIRKIEDKGREEGMARGREERVAMEIEEEKKLRDIEIAKLILSKNHPLSDIIEFTKLSESEIQSLI